MRPIPTVVELLAPEPGEPRELTAARHTIIQLNREHATLNAQHDVYAQAYAAEAAKHEAAVARVAELERALSAVRTHDGGRIIAGNAHQARKRA